MTSPSRRGSPALHPAACVAPVAHSECGSSGLPLSDRPTNIVFVGDPLTAKIVVALVILAMEGHDSRSPLIGKILDEVGYEITAACPVSTDLS
jgi:hypothetical protein